jgi:hypothetical protein
VLPDIFLVVDRRPSGAWAPRDPELCRRSREHPDEDLRAAIGTCALEHRLEEHFDAFFPRVEAAARSSLALADTVLRCWKLGEAELPANAARVDSLQKQCRERLDDTRMRLRV